MITIVDTSIWIEYLRNLPPVTEPLDKDLLAGNIYIVGPVIAELLQGTKTEKDFRTLKDCIEGVPCLETGYSDWQLAGKIAFNLRRKGVTIPVTDCLIAAMAINHKAGVWSLDSHFNLVPGLRLKGLP